MKNYEQNIHQLGEEKDLLERQLRQIQTERNELQHEISTISKDWYIFILKFFLKNISSLFRNTIIEEKRRLESHINQLEEELEEEQTNTELLGDKLKKLAMIHEQDMLDINTERTKNEKFEV